MDLSTKQIDFDYQIYICPRCLRQVKFNFTSDCTDCLNNFSQKVTPVVIQLSPKTEIDIPEDIRKVIEDFSQIDKRSEVTFELFSTVVQATFLHPFCDDEAQEMLIGFFSDEIEECRKELNEELVKQELEEETSYSFTNHMRSAILNFARVNILRKQDIKDMPTVRRELKPYLTRYSKYYIEELEELNYRS